MLPALVGSPEDADFDAATRTSLTRLRSEWATARRKHALARVKPLFSDEDGRILIEAVQHGSAWSVWRPSDPAWPAPASSNLSCVHGQLKFFRSSDAPAQPMCLADNDVVSEGIRRFERWRDCSRLVRIWKALSAEDPLRGGVMLDVGANIGACTMELLLRTSAHVVAFEPYVSRKRGTPNSGVC